jgi:1-phosphofructokinase/tagatose 6-phosphate kinase
VDVDVYARLIRELKRLGVDCVVDTDGDPLRRAVRAEPDVISPNVLEAEELVGHEFNDEEDHVIAGARDGRPRARGGVMTAPDGCYALMGPEEPGAARTLYRVRMAAGSVEPRADGRSGDAFLAGFVASRYLGRSQLDCLAYGVACGAESTQHLGAGSSTPSRSAACGSEIEVERPDVGAFSALHTRAAASMDRSPSVRSQT